MVVNFIKQILNCPSKKIEKYTVRTSYKSCDEFCFKEFLKNTSARTPLTYKIGHSKKLAFTNRFYLRKFLNSIGLLAKKEKNHNNVT